MGPYVKFESWVMRLLPSWVTGFTLYPWINFRTAKAQTPVTEFRHEMQHIYQVRNLGWIRFYATYLWYNLTKGYAGNPYEIEAYAIQNTPLTVAEQAIWDAA